MSRRWFLKSLAKAPILALGAARAAESEVTQLRLGAQKGTQNAIHTEDDPARQKLYEQFYKLAGSKRTRHEMQAYSIEHYPPHLRQPKSWGAAFRQSQYIKWREDFDRDWGYRQQDDVSHIKRILNKFGVSL